MEPVSAANQVCIIDDDPAVGDLLRLVCESMGLSAQTFLSGEDYLISSQRRSSRCAMLLLDIELPGVSGLEIIARLRSEGFDCPILVVSGEAAADTAERALALGAADFIAKPFRVTAMRERIGRLIAR